jgi:hypothetical protein
VPARRADRTRRILGTSPAFLSFCAACEARSPTTSGTSTGRADVVDAEVVVVEVLVLVEVFALVATPGPLPWEGVLGCEGASSCEPRVEGLAAEESA